MSTTPHTLPVTLSHLEATALLAFLGMDEEMPDGVTKENLDELLSSASIALTRALGVMPLAPVTLNLTEVQARSVAALLQEQGVSDERATEDVETMLFAELHEPKTKVGKEPKMAEEDRDLIIGLMTDVVDEGLYCGYWGEVSAVRRNENNDVISFCIQELETDYHWSKPHRLNSTNLNSNSPIQITADSLLEARERMINFSGEIDRDMAAQFVGPPRAWDYDSNGADALIQFAAFGEIVYG